VGAYVFSRLGNNLDDLFRLFGGLLLIVVLLQDANGLVSLYRRLALRLHRWPIRGPTLSLSQNEQVRPPPATLELPEITVRFGGVTALDAVSLTLRPGEVVGLIGANGAGKTTLIDAVTGYVSPTAGHVLLDDRVLDGWSPRRRAVAGIARSFQSLEL